MEDKIFKSIFKYALCTLAVLFVILFMKSKTMTDKDAAIEDNMLDNGVYASVFDLREKDQNNYKMSIDEELNKQKQYNERDKKAYQIVNSSGMWTKEVDLMLPQMTSDGVERIVSIYMQKNGGNEFAFENTKNVLGYINNTADKGILKTDSNRYYDLIADEWYNRTYDIYLVMMLFPNMSTEKVDELVFSYTNETKEFSCVYKSLEYISPDGMDKIIFNYVEHTNDYGIVIAAVDYMTKEGQKRFFELCPFEMSAMFEIRNKDNKPIENSQSQFLGEIDLTQEEYGKFNDSDKKAYKIIRYSGMWNDEIDQLLPNMSSYGVEKTVSLYLSKTRNYNTAKKAFKYIDSTVHRDILKSDSKRYYDLVADEWYNRTNDIYLVMMIVPDMSTEKVDELIFDYIKKTNNFQSLYSIMDFMSESGIDKAVLHYVETTGNYGIVLAATDYMSEDGRNKFMTLYKKP